VADERVRHLDAAPQKVRNSKAKDQRDVFCAVWNKPLEAIRKTFWHAKSSPEDENAKRT